MWKTFNRTGYFCLTCKRVFYPTLTDNVGLVWINFPAFPQKIEKQIVCDEGHFNRVFRKDQTIETINKEFENIWK